MRMMTDHTCMLSRYIDNVIGIVVGMIGKQKLPLFATIFPSFSEVPVMPFSGLPFPLLYNASMFESSPQGPAHWEGIGSLVCHLGHWIWL